MKKALLVFLLPLSLLFLPLWASAQEKPPTLTWFDAPNTFPIRHLGDWYVAMGWYAPSEIYGPFPEAEFDLGDETDFYLATSPYDELATYVLRYKSERTYFWFPPDVGLDEAELARAAVRFDQEIQPFVEETFGQALLKGIDGDLRLHVVHEPTLGYGAVGVFRPIDQCAREICTGSNQRDTIYYALDWGGVNTDEHLTTLAHEYQHVLRYWRDGNERRWMNEGLSQLSEHLNGFAPEYAGGDNLQYFLENPDVRLDAWADYNSDPSLYYGSSYLLMIYLYERLGLDFIQALSASPYDGLPSIAQTLRAGGYTETLDSLYSDWLLANLLDDPFVGDGRYYYATLRVPVQVASVPLRAGEGAPQTYTRTMNQYGANYLALEAGTYRLTFAGAESVALVEDVAPFEGMGMWWSYNADSSVTHLTRRFDLRQVESATLLFELWYQAEADLDWLSVQVSLDGGRKWQGLSGASLRPANAFIPVPHYTGQSGSWLHESLDLSAFAGQDILLRFEYFTDGTLSLGGVLLDNIAIPEIGFFDDAESLAAGWQNDGFLRVGESVPQAWSLALVTRGKAPSVQFLLPMCIISSKQLSACRVAVLF
jgi:hypothetical protein